MFQDKKWADARNRGRVSDGVRQGLNAVQECICNLLMGLKQERECNLVIEAAGILPTTCASGEPKADNLSATLCMSKLDGRAFCKRALVSHNLAVN